MTDVDVALEGEFVVVQGRWRGENVSHGCGSWLRVGGLCSVGWLCMGVVKL